jgi:predicted nucleotidyltransferase
MDLQDPTKAVTPTLDGPILAVLARAGRPLTVGDVATEAARGSEIGIRRSLSRLVEQGLVRATVVGRNRVHELNRDHVAAPVALTLANLRNELWNRFRETLRGWQLQPLYACVFGSAARGDGSVDSDIDLLLVHRPFSGEAPQAKQSTTILERVGSLLATLVSVDEKPPDPEAWHRQVDELRGRVQAWTGNPLQVVDLSAYEWYEPSDGTRRLLDEVKSHNVEFVKHFVVQSSNR